MFFRFLKREDILPCTYAFPEMLFREEMVNHIHEF